MTMLTYSESQSFLIPASSSISLHSLLFYRVRVSGFLLRLLIQLELRLAKRIRDENQVFFYMETNTVCQKCCLFSSIYCWLLSSSAGYRGMDLNVGLQVYSLMSEPLAMSVPCCFHCQNLQWNNIWMVILPPFFCWSELFWLSCSSLPPYKI